MAQNTCASINTFINLPFGFKLFYGMVSDCVPIFGQHRKPYLVGGWGLSRAGLARVSGRSIFSLLGWGSSPASHTDGCSSGCRPPLRHAALPPGGA